MPHHFLTASAGPGSGLQKEENEKAAGFVIIHKTLHNLLVHYCQPFLMNGFAQIKKTDCHQKQQNRMKEDAKLSIKYHLFS